MALPAIQLPIFVAALMLLAGRGAAFRGPVSAGPFVTSENATARFNRNVELLLAALISNSSSSKYHNATIGNSANGTVYGLYVCSGDISGSSCKSCVEDAADIVWDTGNPHNIVQSSAWLDVCYLRFADVNFFGDPEAGAGRMLDRKCMESVSTEAEDAGIVEFLTRIVVDAVGQPSLFASSRNGTRYGSAQCTGDLSKVLCRSCLMEAVENVRMGCKRKGGGSFYTNVCSIRFNDTAARPQPSAGVSPPAVAVLGVCIAIIAGVFLLI